MKGFTQHGCRPGLAPRERLCWSCRPLGDWKTAAWLAGTAAASEACDEHPRYVQADEGTVSARSCPCPGACHRPGRRKTC